MFDALVISPSLISEIEAVAMSSVFQWCHAINVELGLVNVVFLAKFTKERVSKNARCFKIYVKEFVQLNFDRSRSELSNS